MPEDINVGDYVFIPSAKIPGEGSSHAIKKVRAERIEDRSIIINNGEDLKISKKLCHKNIGILILIIGDFSTESNLLYPLGKSILHYCKLLLSDDLIKYCKIRSKIELEKIWNDNHRVITHVIIIGHGRKDGILFANDGWVGADEFSRILDGDDISEKIFISLCCETGKRSFAGTFSRKVMCGRFLAPFQSVHGAVASQYCQTFLSFHLLKGCVAKVSHNNAIKNIPDNTKFRSWKNGRLERG